MVAAGVGKFAVCMYVCVCLLHNYKCMFWGRPCVCVCKHHRLCMFDPRKTLFNDARSGKLTADFWGLHLKSRARGFGCVLLGHMCVCVCVSMYCTKSMRAIRTVLGLSRTKFLGVRTITARVGIAVMGGWGTRISHSHLHAHISGWKRLCVCVCVNISDLKPECATYLTHNTRVQARSMPS